MEETFRKAAIRVAKATESRRSFLGKGMRWTFAAAAALAANASFDMVSASACGCNPPCGQYCGSYVSGSCNDPTIGCSGSCYQDLSYWNPNRRAVTAGALGPVRMPRAIAAAGLSVAVSSSA